jgi:hypothetical protein
MNISTLKKTVLKSTNEGGEVGIICFEATGKWNQLRSVLFTEKRHDIDNVMLEDLLSDKNGIAPDWYGNQFKPFDNGYSFNSYYKNGFDTVNSEDHLAFKEGKEYFCKFMKVKYDNSDYENSQDWEKYQNAVLNEEGHLAELQVERLYKTFMYAGKEHYNKFVESVDGLKINPKENKDNSKLFEYCVSLISFKLQPFFLKEWFNEIRKVR